jgi:predicted O-methyltransferase YrrM
MTAWYQRSAPDQIKPLPWLAPRVVAHLESILRPEWSVIEHGSGGSTLWFAERCEFVTAVERDPDWRREVGKGAPQNVAVIEFLNTVDGLTFDLCLIDGEPVEDRSRWINTAPQLVRPGGWVVLDNANRPEYATERGWLQSACESYETFDCNEAGTAYLVTEFYKMKG